MKLEMEIDIEKFKYGLVGNGYLLEEVISMSDERALEILKSKIYQKIQNEYVDSKPIIQDALIDIEKNLKKEYGEETAKVLLKNLNVKDL